MYALNSKCVLNNGVRLTTSVYGSSVSVHLLNNSESTRICSLLHNIPDLTPHVLTSQFSIGVTYILVCDSGFMQK